MPDERRYAAPAPGAGFTLLEVLAAVLIFAVVFTTLAGHSMDWVRNEGVSERRMRASLIADEILSDLEAGISLGSLPETGEDESERDEFTVVTEIEPWDPPFDLSLGDTDDGGAEADGASLLATTRSNPDGVLRRIRVRVGWLDGLDEHEVSRTTFAYDAEAAGRLLEAAGIGGDDDGGDAGGGEESSP